jgi:hypothetical protein
MGTQCRKDQIAFKYNFIEKIDLNPAQKSYKVGDTIWLQYTNSNNMLFDKNSRQKILADTVSITIGVSYYSRYLTETITPTSGVCDFILISGVNFNISQGTYGTGGLFGFGCSAGGKTFKLAIVPRFNGIYSLNFRSFEYVGGCSNRISSFPNSSMEYRFNVADCNKDIYLSIPPNSRGESIKGYTEGQIDNKQVFILRVE